MNVSTFATRCSLAAALLAVALSCGACSKRTDLKDVTKNSGGAGGTSDSSNQDGNGDSRGSATEGALQLKDVFFSFDDATIAADGRAVLARNAEALKARTDARVTIEGHCDERGTLEYNLALGQRRAEAALAYLVNSGVDAGRLTTISYGELRPFASGSGESVWSQNRRAHFETGMVQ